MKKSLAFLALTLLGKTVCCQTNDATISYRGIDSFFIGDPISKYYQRLEVIKNGQGIERENGNKYYGYMYSKPAANIISIAGISFGSLLLDFLGDSTLTSFNFFKPYNKRRDSSYTELKADQDFNTLKNYINLKLNKKGVAKNYSKYKSFIYHGYEWEEDDFILKINIQYSNPNTNQFKSIGIDFMSKSLAGY